MLGDLDLNLEFYHTFSTKSENYTQRSRKICRQISPSWENLDMQYVNNKSADHPAPPHGLISAFIAHSLDILRW